MIRKIPNITCAGSPYFYGKRDTECIYELLGKKDETEDDFQSVIDQEVAKLKGEENERGNCIQGSTVHEQKSKCRLC